MSSSGRSSTASLPAIFLSWRIMEKSIGYPALVWSRARLAVFGLDCKPAGGLGAMNRRYGVEDIAGKRFSFLGSVPWCGKAGSQVRGAVLLWGCFRSPAGRLQAERYQSLVGPDPVSASKESDRPGDLLQVAAAVADGRSGGACIRAVPEIVR